MHQDKQIYLPAQGSVSLFYIENFDFNEKDMKYECTRLHFSI